MDILKYGSSIITAEIEALNKLKKNLNRDFETVVKLIASSKGKLILSGVGKSAHIANKIVATLNSTGTSSAFLHATEAVHGDLGIIHKNDIIIIISKSGESTEIVNLVSALKKFNIPIVGMVGNINSTLAKYSDYILNAAVDKEACYNNLAPTNSTTCQLVLGDALAMCLMKIKKFTAQDFSLNHPGGALGKKLLLNVRELSKHNKTPKVFKNIPLKNVIVEISKGRLGATAVVDKNNKVLGIITDGDIRRLFNQTYNLEKNTAGDIMVANPQSVFDYTLASEAMKILNDFNINQLIIMNTKKEYVGIIHLHDILKEGIY